MSRLPALVALLVLVAAFAAVLVITTPWSPLPGPVPGGPVPVDPAREFTAAQLAREDAFHSALHWASYGALVVGLAAAAVLGLTSWGARMIGRLARPLGGSWPVQVMVGVIAVTVITTVVALPLRARAEAVLRDYGLSTQSWTGWLADVGRSLGISIGLTVLALLAGYALVRALPRSWWIAVGLGGAALVFAGSFLYPVVIEPVFNTFTPLPAGQLRSDLLALAAQDAVPVDQVLVADASRRTTSLNAYVSGYGSSRRIVVYDTLLAQDTPAQVRLVVAHELGHADAHDVLHGTVLGALGGAAAACGAYLLFSWAPLLHRAGVDHLGDPRSVALVLFVVAVATLAASPVQNLVSRHIEARADVHSLNLTGEPATFISSQRSLALSNISDLDPGPVLYGMFFTHPTPPERIALARDWARQHGVELP